MTLRIPRAGAAGLIFAVVVAVALFLYFSDRFGGPALRLSSPYRVSVTMPDTKGLARRSDVFVRGVRVGRVDAIGVHGQAAKVTLVIDDRYAPIHRDATVRAGEKTLLGESYVDLNPGHTGEARVPSGGALPPSHTLPAAVEIDQALGALNSIGRRHMQGLLRTFASGARAPDASDEVSQTLGRLDRLTGALRTLTEVLRGQESDIAAGVEDGRTALAQLGEREAEVRALVAGGRATLGSLAASRQGLRAGVHELPLLLAGARATLRDVQPLLAEARPLLADLRTAAPPLAAALGDLRPVAQDANRVIARLPAFDAAVVPFLGRAARVLGEALPVAGSLPPAVRNLVTIARYLSDHRQGFAAWFANTADIGASGDAKGKWARFFIFMEHGTAFGTSGAFENNAYTAPGDALDNQPYKQYPKQFAYSPPRP